MDQEQLNYARLSVLVIEDQPFVRRVIDQILRQIGFRHIFQAADGESGLAQCACSMPDLVICDINMEPVSGLEFLARLRSGTENIDNQTPVIFLTNHAERETVMKAISLGVDSFVVKPPSFNSLKERIDRLVRAR